jgi:hypothetical protein
VPRSVAIEFYQVSVLFRETEGMVEHYEKMVREGKELSAAANFARYVRWSGLLKVFKANANDSIANRVDGALLEWRVEELQRMVQDRWKDPDAGPKFATSTIEGIEHKLDLIAGYLANLRAS